jgi:hypothetical protein
MEAVPDRQEKENFFRERETAYLEDIKWTEDTAITCLHRA